MRQENTRTTAATSDADRPAVTIHLDDEGVVSPLLCPILVGRQRELEVLQEAMKEAGAGNGRTVFVLGEAGVGKSRLVGHLASQAASEGFTVVRGRAIEGDRTTSFRPLAEAFQRHLRRRKLPDVPGLEPYLPGLAWLIPDLRRRAAPALDEPLIVVGEGLLRLLAALGGNRATMLILEDLHWADSETLSVVEYLSDHLRDEAMLCVVTIRQEEASEARTLAHALADRRTGQLVELQRLKEAETRRMARACLGTGALPGGLADFLVDRAQGLPFLVEEMLAASAACGALRRHGEEWEFEPSDAIPVPQGFADSIRRRLSVIGDEAFEVLAAAAVLGRHFRWEVLAPTVGMSDEVVQRVLRRAIETQLVEVAGVGTEDATYRFRHALTQEVMLQDLLPSQRAARSLRALEAIQAAHPGLPGDWCLLAVQLSAQAGDPVRAAPLHLEAGRRAYRTGNLTSAERLLDAAREHAAGQPALRLEIDRLLTEVLALMGKPTRVREVGLRLLEQLERIGAPDREQAELHLNLARAAGTATNWAVARRHLERAQSLAGRGDVQELLPRIDALAAHIALGEGRPEEAEQLSAAAVIAAERHGLEKPGMAAAACEALEVAGRRARLRDMEEAERAFARSLCIAETHDLSLWRLRALHELGTIDLYETWRVDRLRQARELARQEGALATAAFIDLNLAAVHGNRLELEEGLELARASERAARRFELGLLQPISLVIQGGIHAMAMRRAEMEAAVETALEIGEGDLNVARGVWGQCRAELSFVLNEQERALEELETAMDYIRRRDTDPWPFRGTWALLRTVLGQDGDAAREELRASVGAVSGINRAYLAYADAAGAGAAGREADAEALFMRAEAEISKLEGATWKRHRARFLVAQAALNDGWGDPVTWLQEAGLVFGEYGHERLVAACQALLRQVGARLPRRPGRRDEVPAELRLRGVTPREMDVLRLLGQRLSNREIAERLVLSPRTVEKHVERLLAKTGAASRRDLVRFAPREPTGH